ncbi:MAG: hypothetical protein HOC20_09640 [Chloroflexi bacterium]|jgi:hypothetical protein|nr:hypothetical protein [Chloroflexota bacterium]
MGVRDWLTKSRNWKQRELPSSSVGSTAKGLAGGQDLAEYSSDEETNDFLRELQELASQMKQSDSDNPKPG